MPDVLVLNPESNVAVATLWTKKEIIVGKLRELGVDSKVNVVGTLYTRYGVNYLLHTLSQHPEIDTVIVFGADLSGSGEALVELFRGGSPEGLRLMWPLEELKPLLDAVRVLDLREAFRRGDYQALADAVNKSFSLGVRRQRLSLELKEVRASSWPVQVAGLSFVEEDVVRAWAKLLDAVMTWGFLKESEYGEKQKQVLGAQVVLYAEKALASSHRLSEFFPRDELDRHVESLLRGLEGASYSYGERLRRHREAGDQLERLVSRLASSPSTRRAVALTWDFQVDPSSSDPPCLLVVQGDLSGGRYNQLAYFRSHDAYAGWPVNVYGLLRLMEHVSLQLSEKSGRSVRPGFLVVFSASLHVYEHDFARAREVVDRHRREFAAFVEDPKGNFLVRVEGSRIVLELRDQEGVLVQSLTGSSARELLSQLNLDALMPRHASYLTRELVRAEEALRSGREYIQDAV